MLLFVVGGVIAAVILGATFIVSAVENGQLLFELEPLPEKGKTAKNDKPASEFAVKMNA